MDIICTNDVFSSDKTSYFKKNGIETPTKDSLYTIRNVIVNSNGKTGLLLEEIVNPRIPILHPLFPGEITMIEPNWDIKRFSTLLGDSLNIAEVKNLLKKTTAH